MVEETKPQPQPVPSSQLNTIQPPVPQQRYTSPEGEVTFSSGMSKH